FVFSDRGIYRPGDDINLGIIVRNSDWSDISGIPVKVVLKDPFSKTVFEKTATLNATGFLTVDGIKTYNVSPTGTYSASVYLIKDDKSEFLLGSASVTVQEFRTDTIKVSAKITGAAGSGWTLPENLKTLVTVNNFFGTPAQNRNVKASYALSPTEFTFPKYAGFRFPDPYRLNTRNAVQSQSENFADAKTDENGEASFAFDLSKYSGGTYNLTFSAEAFEGDSGKSVFTYDSVKVSPYKYLLGYKTTSKLEYLNKGASSTLNIVAVDNDLKGVTLKDLKLRVKQIQYISSLVKQDNGVYKFQSVAKETVISEKPLNISADGISAGGSALSLNTENPGTFVLEIEDGQGMKILNIQYFVAGSSNQSFTIEKDANLTINLESNEVAPGNQLTLNITAPYTGAGLITIEKDKVYAYKWFQTDTNSSVQRITVPENLEGNAYVNVSFIRSINSKEIFSSPHSYAVVPFKVNMAKRKAVISLQTPEMIRPGEELEISYKTSQNSKIVVYAVDQGILQVAGYTTPNPLAFFFAKGALQVQTFQTVDMILPDYKIIREIAGIGGGEGYDMIAKNLNPFARKQAKPVVFWSSTLEATTEYQKVKFKVPDYFNGQLKVMAVAANPQQAGSADKDVIVKSQVIIMPVAPLAAITGDTFEVTATVSNNIEGSKSAALDVWLETNKKFEITGTNKQTIEVKEGGEKIVRFTLKTLDSLGSGDIVFKAQHKQDIYKSEVSVSVRPAFAYQTMIKSGVSKKAKTEISGFARDMYDEFANREITASYNPQLIFFSLKSYFSKYPYGCTEQIVSAAFPFIYPATSNRKGFITADEQQAMFNNALSKVRLRQLSSGGFALWPNSSDIDNYVSVYALHFFTDAKELDYPAPNEILAAGKNWLQYFASELPRSMEDARLKAYANYVLTRNGYITTNNLLMLEDYLNSNQKKWQKDIISAYMASCYSLLRDFKKADALIKSYVPETKDKFIFYSDFDSSSQRNAIYLYLCNKHFAQNLNPDAQAIADGLVQIIMDGKYNTISSAHILLALLSYGVSMEGKDAGITISAKGKDGKEKQLTLNADPFPYSKFSSDVSGFTVNSDADTGRVYYSVIQQGFDRTLKEYANGLELMREYIDANGAVVKSAKLGDTLTARIRVKNKSYDYVSLVIVDLLPAAFEIISGTQSGSFSSVDAREDRMIFFATVGKSITELTYQVKVVTKGAFTVPGVYAAAMYDPEISAQTKTGTIEITQPADNGK
ncbi:MAG: MG2 domain-containing protein, partial [Endomicrobia bacterium]|nr:MG2 domain-containing protein [Endomicrobiia bacterium]